MDKCLKLFAAVIISTTFWNLPAFAASFDCSKATTETEIAICNDPELSALDERMSNAYMRARLSQDGEQYKNEQFKWLKERDLCSGDKQCLKNAYNSILSKLSNFDNCSKSTTVTEIAICSNEELSALDDLMAILYEQALRSNDWRYYAEDRDDTDIIVEQKASISQKTACYKNTNCLKDFYIARIERLIRQADITHHNFSGNPAEGLLTFSKFLGSDVDIQSIASDPERQTMVALIFESDPREIRRYASGTVFNSNPMKILIKSLSGILGTEGIQVIEDADGAVFGVNVEVKRDTFSIIQPHTRFTETIKYSLRPKSPASDYFSWERDRYTFDGVSNPAAGQLTKTDINYQTGAAISSVSFIYLDCEIKEQPTLIGDSNYEAISQIIGFKEEYRPDWSGVSDEKGLINLMQVLSDREVHLIAVEAFSYENFEIARKGFEILASRDYPDSEQNLECVLDAIGSR